jgi:aspartyl-tRNA(Asn)/glutamyl-tRNA(Gln) amidotransferase subunit A
MEQMPGSNAFGFWRALANRDPAGAARAVLSRIAALAPEHRRSIWAIEPDEPALIREFVRGVATGGPLAGVPFAVKDLFAVQGFPTGAGSTFLARRHGPAAGDAPIVDHLRRAGAVFAGKVHLHEFAYGLTGENPHFGDGPNLRLPGRLSGGSSSGSAAVVAAGIVPLALGTDTGGSVRVPAAFNGLWGFRARPHDRWIAQCFPLSPTFDTAGWFTNSAAEMLAVQHTIFGRPATISATRGFVRLAARELAPEMDAGFAARLDDAAALLTEPLPAADVTALRRALEGALKAYVVIQSSEAATVHAEWLDERKADYDPVVWARIDSGRRWTASDIAVAHAKQAEIRDAFGKLFERHDGLVLPAAPFPALTKAECTDENRSRILRLTHAASLAGAPVLTQPVTMPDGTFGGLQIVLPDYHTAASEAVLLRRDAVEL